MADLIINPSSLNRPGDYEGRDYDVELSELPKTRYVSFRPDMGWDALGLTHDRQSTKLYLQEQRMARRRQR